MYIIDILKIPIGMVGIHCKGLWAWGLEMIVVNTYKSKS